MDTLIDSSVLVRVHDSLAEPYSRAAERALYELSKTGRGALSAQSLAEFATYARFNLYMPHSVLLEQIERLIVLFPVLPITVTAVAASIRIESRRNVGHYEAQVRAVAQENGLKYILSEDRQNGFQTDGIRYINVNRNAPTLV